MLICYLNIINSECPIYLLYVSDVHQLDNFILLGGARPGAGALKAQITEREREIKKQAAERPKEEEADRRNRHKPEF